MEKKEELLEIVAQLNPPRLASVDTNRIANPHDIAHVLAQIVEPGPSYFGRLKFAGQEAWAKDAANYLSMRLFEKMPSYKTPAAFIGHDMLRKISEAAIWEHMGNTLCPTCNGRGDFKAEGMKIITCPTCEGFRVTTIKHRRHHVFGMTADEWKRWERIYLQALGILDKWQGKIYAVMAWNFGRSYLAANFLGERIKNLQPKKHMRQ